MAYYFTRGGRVDDGNEGVVGFSMELKAADGFGLWGLRGRD